MAVEEELKVDQTTEQPAPDSGDSTTTIDAEATVQTQGGGDAAKGEQGMRKHMIALSIVLCQLVVALPFGSGLLVAYTIPPVLGADPSLGIWIAASYPLTEATFVLMGGRVGAVHGHKKVLVIGGVVYILFNLLSGFMRTVESLIVMRALTGVGAGIIVPNAIALLTTSFPPGIGRLIWVGLFGAMAPVGAGGGSIFPGFFGQLLPWWWLFFFFAIAGAVIFGAAAILVPSEEVTMDPNGRVDYVGSYFGVGGLILFNFAWTEAAIKGWKVDYVYIILILSVLHIALFLVWEARYAKDPILPLTVWSAPSFKPMLLSAFFTFMSVGILFYYITRWHVEVRHFSNFLNAASFVTFTLIATLSCGLSAVSVRYLPAQIVMAIGTVSALVAGILLATMPLHQTYWPQEFPALFILGLSPDFIFTAAQIITSNSVKRSLQGVAGSLVGTIQLYGLGTGLGFAGTIELYTNKNGADPIGGIRHALWFSVALAGVATLTCVLIRIPKDQREGWDEEEEQAHA
ncbi:efflux pump antibiotic resistance [Trichoderma arundinaceum]|uniref:Efflux pump antibiotic resistance n=1 Tax=Trichoderma arundinaceum TaxID=490622 RepID=A0A395NMD8_TRIAR|nr:efflux pump antibiotic resistance [Trichoderma arundinaceum]